MLALLAVVAAGCTGVADGASDEPPVADPGGTAVLEIGDETHEFRVLERCILGEDGAGRVLVKGVGEHDGEVTRLEVRRGASPVVDGEMVDEVEVTRAGAPWVTQAVPVTTQQPAPLFQVDGMGVAGDDIEFRRHDAPVETVAGRLDVVCP